MKKKMIGGCSPPHPSNILLDERNGRFVGTIIKTQWNKTTYFSGTVIKLAKFPYLRVQYDDGKTHVIDPRLTISRISYRPPRIGRMYQADIPACR